MRSTAFGLFATLMIGAANAASASGAYRALPFTGSEVLVVHAFSQPGLPDQVQRQRMEFEARQGYRRIPGISGHRSLTFRPILTWDPNVNGGLPNDSVIISGYTFRIDPDYVGKSGLLVGIEGMGSLRENLAPGLALDLRARGSFAYAPQHRVHRAALDLDACLRYQVNPSRYLHGCAGYEFRSAKLGRSSVFHGTIGATQAFNLGNSMHAVTAELGVRRVMPHGGAAWTQGFARLSTASALSNGVAVHTSLELGQRVAGVHVTTLMVSGGVTWRINERPTSVALSYRRSEGGMFLGQERRDQTYALSVSHQINPRLTLTGSVSRTRSNAALFNTGTSVGIGLRMTF